MFSASAVNGFNPRFRWDFGRATTAWSSAPRQRTITAPGVYQVTVTAVDDRGIETRQTFLR
jgi:PKD repeat protein